MNKIYKILFGIITLFIVLGLSITQEIDTQDSNSKKAVSGFFKPNGKPIKAPVKIDAGESCIIDLIQGYSISGDISGSIEMNYRIIVYGKCGSPPGTYNEEWIAHGIFKGTIIGEKTNAKLSYTAKVKAGGDVNGLIIFGQGTKAKLLITGNFSDGKLLYKGEVY